jgi:hypothetical protein
MTGIEDTLLAMAPTFAPRLFVEHGNEYQGCISSVAAQSRAKVVIVDNGKSRSMSCLSQMFDGL